jgi:serine/threonine protein kinase
MAAGMPTIEYTTELEENISHRGKAYVASKNSLSLLSDEMPEDYLTSDGREKTASIYCRSSDCEEVKLEDFELISIIGKGNFGKVYLVFCPYNQQYYAMKSIRKDIVLDNDSLESVKLEKLILLQVNNPFIVNMQFVY